MVEKLGQEKSLARHLGVPLRGWGVERAMKVEEDPGCGLRWPWGIFDNTLSGYSDTFKKVIPTKDLALYAHDIVTQEGYQTIIDLMASEAAVGHAVSELGLSAGVAVSLGLKHDTYWDSELGADTISMVNGDLVLEDTWSRIRSAMETVSPGGFDLVVSRPEGGLKSNNLPIHSALYYLLFQRIWSIAAPRSTLLLQVPIENLDESFDYLSRLKKRIGIEVLLPESHAYLIGGRYGYGIRIEKMPSDPSRLPSPHKLGMKYMA